jgi:hypothetical protein
LAASGKALCRAETTNVRAHWSEWYGRALAEFHRILSSESPTDFTLSVAKWAELFGFVAPPNIVSDIRRVVADCNGDTRACKTLLDPFVGRCTSPISACRKYGDAAREKAKAEKGGGKAPSKAPRLSKVEVAQVEAKAVRGGQPDVQIRLCARLNSLLSDAVAAKLTDLEIASVVDPCLMNIQSGLRTIIAAKRDAAHDKAA